MFRRSTAGGVAIAATAGLVVSLAVAGPAAAEKRGIEKFGKAHKISLSDLAVKPLALQSDRKVTVMLRIDGPSVASVAGPGLLSAAGASVSERRQAAIRAEGRAAQSGAVAAVTASGGVVLNRLSDAVNVVVARVPASALPSLRNAPGVADLQQSKIVNRTNQRSDLYTGAADAWKSYGVTGRGVKIAIVDDGIDYTHADFGGKGTPAAYNKVDPLTTAGVFPTKKVIDGYDFVGDDYDASSEDDALTVPAPDPNPIACGEHGTHVSGTAAGFGVTKSGKTYSGKYSSKAIKDAKLRIGPGSAPQAKLMAYKVFGCEGSVDDFIIIYAIDRAVRDGANVINMSLGSDYGSKNDIESVAIENATDAGALLVVSAGNAGPAPYIVGGPSTSPSALSVAAMDAFPSFPGAKIGSISAINANGGPLPVTADVFVLMENGDVSLGCDPYSPGDAALAAGKIVVFARGTCARVDKALNAQAAGAVAAVMINNATGYPPFEGDVPGLTIPFLGVSDADKAALVALDGTNTTITSSGLIANPTYAQAAAFTSSGPRSGDGAIKPEISAPGVSLFSALVGSGSQGENLSGTSMAAPHTSGVSALVRQAHPKWAPRLVKAALVGTAERGANKVSGDVRNVGNGLVSPLKAIKTNLVMVAPRGAGGLAFGVLQPSGALDKSDKVKLVNRGSKPVKVKLSINAVGPAQGAKWSVSPSSVTVQPGSKKVRVRLRLSTSALANLSPAGDEPNILSGRLKANPAKGPTLRIPTQAVAYGRSNVTAALNGSDIDLANGGLREGTADFYEWIGSASADPGVDVDLRALGYQSFADPGDRFTVFAINQDNRFSNPAANEYDLLFDTDGDDEPDHLMVVTDGGLVLTGSADGSQIALTIDLGTGDAQFFLYSPIVDGGVVFAPTLATWLGLKDAGDSAAVSMEAYSLVTGAGDVMADGGVVRPWDQQRSNGDFESVAVGASVSVPVTTRALKPGEDATKGWMVVTVDDKAGKKQAALVAATP